ncbi:MAG: nitrous oxide reductase accessory protein NosL [Thiotrichales bacterium]
MHPLNAQRRALLRGLAAGSALGVIALNQARADSSAATRCETDGTPLQFIPKTEPDAEPLTRELEKYPKCPYCGMDRTQWHHSRHLVVYEDDLVDGTCSIHCLALSLAINLDRGPKAIYAADFGADTAIKPLINVDDARYLIGSRLKGTMTTISKMAFADETTAMKFKAENAGELGDFDAALRAAYAGLADDTKRIRKMRAERRAKMKAGT